MIEGGFFLTFESDPERPFFRPIVSRSRKMLGDNADAIYYTAPVRSDRCVPRHRQPRRARCTSRSRSRRNTTEGGYSTETAGVLNDDRDFDVAADGSFEVFFGGEPATATGSSSPNGASELIVRCYFEEADAGRGRRRTGIVPLTIETARAGRSAGALGRRVGRGRVPAGQRTSSAAARSSSRSRASGCSRRGCRRRRT